MLFVPPVLGRRHAMRYNGHSGLPQWARIPALAWKTWAGDALRHALNDKGRATRLYLLYDITRSRLQAVLRSSACYWLFTGNVNDDPAWFIWKCCLLAPR